MERRPRRRTHSAVLVPLCGLIGILVRQGEYFRVVQSSNYSEERSLAPSYMLLLSGSLPRISFASVLCMTNAE